MTQLTEPMRDPKATIIAAAIVSFAAFVLYFFTLAPTVTLVDSGELIVTAAKLGVAHPPGFPLYVLLAHIASLLPVGNVAVRVHLASALFAALAAGVMTLLVSELMSTAERKKADKKNKKRVESVTENVPIWFVFGPAVIAGLLFASARTLWAYATLAEVYTLNAFLIVSILWLMFAWRREFLAAVDEKVEPSYKKLYIAGLVFGLALGVHHVTVGLFLPSLAILVYKTAGKEFFLSRRFGYAALISIAGLVSIYAYLPIAASRFPLIDWGEPRTFDAIWQHVTGKQYQVFFDLSATRITNSLRMLSHEFGVAWLPAGLILAGLGLVHVFRKTRPMFAFLTTVIVLDIIYCLVWGGGEDKDAYFIPTFISLIIAAGYGARWAIQRVGKALEVLTPARAAAALLAVPAIALASNFAYNDRHRYYIAHDFVDNMFASVEPGGMLLTSDWQAYSPSLYVREIEGQRKDITFLDVNLLRRSWYFSYLDQAYPDLLARSRAKVDAFREELHAWDRDPAAYERSPTLKQRINTRFQEMLLSFVTEQLKTGPLYFTPELADPNETSGAGLVKLLQQKYDLAAQGIVLRLTDKGSSTFLQPPQINIRGLNDGTVRFEDDDVPKRVLIPSYLLMLTNTGIYLGNKGDPSRAAVYFRQALEIDPSSDTAKKGLAASQAALQQK